MVQCPGDIHGRLQRAEEGLPTPQRRVYRTELLVSTIQLTYNILQNPIQTVKAPMLQNPYTAPINLVITETLKEPD